MMQQRWNRKRTHLPLLAVFFLLFLVFTILHNERRILRIQQDHPDHVHRHQEASITYVKPNLLTYENRAPGMTLNLIGILSLLYSSSWVVFVCSFYLDLRWWVCLCFLNFQWYWIDSVDATTPESTVAGKLSGLRVNRSSLIAESVRRAATCFPANGFLIILHFRFTMRQSVRTCLTSWLVRGMGGLIWITSTGDGNPMVAI